MSFILDYFNLCEGMGEVAVCCPFPHRTLNGIEYEEQRASAHVNTDNNLFHCKACNRGYAEQGFIASLLGMNNTASIKLANFFSTTETEAEWDKEVLQDTEKALANTLGISDHVIKQLKLKSEPNRPGTLVFPVMMYGHLIDLRKYTPGGTPKMRGRLGSMNGLIIPYDIWEADPTTTYICAGEKDMAVTRSHGFNAITLTGGEATPPAMLNPFKDRTVVICYDNDMAGKEGAERLATKLYGTAKKIKICTGFHEVCAETGEDLTDFFVKYGKTREDLIDYVKATPLFTPVNAAEQTETIKELPIGTLHEATDPNTVGTLVRSNIQVVAVSEAAYFAASSITATKVFKSENDQGSMEAGEVREWLLTQQNVEDVLHLMDGNFTDKALRGSYARLCKIPEGEKNVRYTVNAHVTVFKAVVTDMLETRDADVVPMEFVAYSVNERLVSGTKYLASYKLVPNPYRGQQLTMLIVHSENAVDSIAKFEINDETKAYLKVFQDTPGTVAERAKIFTEKFKGILQYNGNNDLIQVLDLSFHTPLKFNFGRHTDIRGYLDTLVVGESRVGKSSTANAMRETYGLGTFVSLAGNAATIPGLVGGSNKVNGNMQTRAGVIPQNHRGLLIFEELSKSHAGVVGELTDIRSSNEVRITRVSGTLTLPAFVRMVSLTNVSTAGGFTKAISSYPNGIAIATELIGSAEDIARYDLVYILSDRGTIEIDPLWCPDDPFNQDEYRARIRWVWSRGPGNIVFHRDAQESLVRHANRLNREYDSHIKIFGTEAWKKLARLSVAVAGWLVSTDESYEVIQVTKEIVDYAAEFIERLYNNETFKLKEFVEDERRYSVLDDEGIEELQSIYDKQPALIFHLEREMSTSRAAIQSATGMGVDEYNGVMNRMVMGAFIQFDKNEIIPSQRFRLAAQKIQRRSHIGRIGHVQLEVLNPARSQ